MFWILISFVIFLIVVHVLLNYNSIARPLRKIPGPKDYFILGNAPNLLQTSVGLMKLGRSLADTFDGIYRIWVCPFGAVNIYNADDVEIIISGTKFNEKSHIYTILKPWLRDGLLLSKGTKWQQRRKILTPTFHFNILRKFGITMQENATRLLENIENIVDKPVDVTHIISEFTLNSICETAMGTTMTDDTLGAKSYKEAILHLGFIFFQRFIKIYYMIECLFNVTHLGKKQNKYLKTVHAFTKRVIEERKEYIKNNNIVISDPGIAHDVQDEELVYKKNKKMAMLDWLITAQQQGLIDDIGIQEEVDTFMFEGHDTTASGLTFCFMLLANNSFAQEKIYEELQEIYGDSNRPIHLDDLPKMRYLERCIKESLRLYPPVHFISRSINEPVILSNYKIPAGVFCHIHIVDLHRNPDHYKNPDLFDPDRFLPENSANRHPYAYIPFSAGPRNCIGQKFAMMEMKIVVANVLREYSLKPVTRPEDVQMLADIVLRNDGPVEVIFQKRITK